MSCFEPPAQRPGEADLAYAHRLGVAWARWSTDEKPTEYEALRDQHARRWPRMPAVAPVSPAWRKVARIWAADKVVPLFLSAASAAAFALGWQEPGLVLLGAASYAWGASS